VCGVKRVQVYLYIAVYLYNTGVVVLARHLTIGLLSVRSFVCRTNRLRIHLFLCLLGILFAYQ